MKKPARRTRPLFVACAVLVSILFLAIISFSSRMKNYSELLGADAMNVYHNGAFVETIPEPPDIIATYNGIVGVGVIDISKLGLKKSDFIELYTLEFVKNNKAISTIEMLALQLNDGMKERTVSNFRKFNGESVVMYEDGYYFIFGQKFYDDLSGLLAT